MKTLVHGKIDEFIQWHDDEGNIINASDGGVIFADGKYHWYGMALRPAPFDTGLNGGQKTDVGVVMYQSTDLLNWKYEGVILPVSKDPESPLYAPLRFERPKIIYNEKTKQYVLWCHYVVYPGNHGTTPKTAEAGVAVCDKVNGTYTWQGTCRPIDNDGLVKDCTLYKDFDGSAYFIYDRVVGSDRCLHVVKLSEDYLHPTDTYTRIIAATWREAPAVIYKNGYYYIVTSDLTSWDYNQAKVFRAKRLLDQWEDMGDPCVNDELHTTFNTQSSYAFPVENKDLYVLMLERHNKKNFLECSYVWLPVKFEKDDSISISYVEEWNPNL